MQRQPARPSRQQPGESFSSKVTAQERQLYDDAIRKAEKVLANHPKSKWVDDALWLIGKSCYNMGDFFKAERKFKELVTNFSESKYVDDSYYYMGLCQINLGHNDQAFSAFSSIENAPKASPFLPDVIFTKGNMEIAAGNNAAAEALFDSFLERFSGHDSAARAMYNIGVCREKQKSYFGAYQAFSHVARYGPSRTLYFDALLASAASALRSDSIQTGMKILKDLSEDERFFSRSSDIHLRLAEGFYLQGDIDKALETYKEITTQNPRTPQSAEAYYRLGLIYQNDRFDLAAAKEAFSKAQGESPESEYKRLALARSAQIAKLETFQMQLQRADSLKRFGESNPPSILPIAQPDTVSVNTDSSGGIGVDSLQGQSLIDGPMLPGPDAAVDSMSAQPMRDTAALIVPAVADGPVPFDTLLRLLRSDSIAAAKNPSPENLLSNEVNADSIGVRDTLAPGSSGGSSSGDQKEPLPGSEASKVNEDSIRQSIIQAGIETRYMLSELYAYELNRPDSALREYLLIAEEYPESPYATKSLLAAAQIEIGRNDSASANVYLRRLVSQYPESPQAVQAAEMLNTPLELTENAMGLYTAAESLIFEAENPDSAMMLLRYIQNKFPDLAPKASFAIAWILDQVIGVEDSSAFQAYAEVVKKYPDTEYALAASDRLSTNVRKDQRKATPRERGDEPQEPAEELPDTSQQFAGGFPLAPPPRITGQFVYPEALLSKELRGKVIFKIKIDISGKVGEYEIIGPSGEYAIDSSATAALLQTEFDTSELDLVQLDSYFQYSIPFRRPDVRLFNDPYREQRERGGPQ